MLVLLTLHLVAWLGLTSGHNYPNRPVSSNCCSQSCPCASCSTFSSSFSLHPFLHWLVNQPVSVLVRHLHSTRVIRVSRRLVLGSATGHSCNSCLAVTVTHSHTGGALPFAGKCSEFPQTASNVCLLALESSMSVPPVLASFSFSSLPPSPVSGHVPVEGHRPVSAGCHL